MKKLSIDRKKLAKAELILKRQKDIQETSHSQNLAKNT